MTIRRKQDKFRGKSYSSCAKAFLSRSSMEISMELVVQEDGSRGNLGLRESKEISHPSFRNATKGSRILSSFFSAPGWHRMARTEAVKVRAELSVLAVELRASSRLSSACSGVFGFYMQCPSVFI